MNQYNENNERVGYWEVYFNNGNLWSKGNYSNGKQIGYWEYCEYYERGDKLSYKKIFI